MSEKFASVVAILENIEASDIAYQDALVAHIMSLKQAIADISQVARRLEGDQGRLIQRICESTDVFNEATGL